MFQNKKNVITVCIVNATYMQKFCIIAREWGEGGIKGVLTLPYNPYSPFSTFRYEESSEQATIAFQKFLKI